MAKRLGKAIASRVSSLPERHGRRTLVILAVILAVGAGLRLERVVNPNADPGDDALAYTALAKSLYEEGSYGGEEFENPDDWSPGAPLLYSGVYHLIGDARDGAARLLQALMGTLAILVAYLLGRRLSCRPAGLVGAGLVAVYPPFIHSTGAVLSEPPALLTFPAAILAYLWAADGANPWRWLVPGLLFGATALIRPEYLLVAILLGAVALGWGWRRGGLRVAAVVGLAFAVGVAAVVLPWTVRNLVVLDKLVPISTGGGKALYVGTYIEADGDYQEVKSLLVERYEGRSLAADSEELDEVDPVPLFDRVWQESEYAGLERDEALGRIGRDRLEELITERPDDYAWLLVEKTWRIWSSGVGEALESTPGRVIQVILVLLGIAGLASLLIRGQRFEALVVGVPLAAITAVGAISLASNRRSEVLMTLVLPLAGTAIARGNAALRRNLAAR